MYRDNQNNHNQNNHNQDTHNQDNHPQNILRVGNDLWGTDD